MWPAMIPLQPAANASSASRLARDDRDEHGPQLHPHDWHLPESVLLGDEPSLVLTAAR